MTWKNKLYFGDNLDIMRNHIPDESVDLIYLDPPFNSKATYNVLFQEKDGSGSAAQITAFDDTWHWDIKAEEAFHQIVTEGPKKLADLIQALRTFLGQNDMMAYLVMMAIRLVEMHRILKPSGSIYLHCDPTASHYLKLVMDSVFGVANYLNEIVWCYKERETIQAKWNPKHDIIFFYQKTNSHGRIFNWESVAEPYSQVTLSKFKYVDDQGRHYQIRGRNIKNSPVRAADGLRPEHEEKYPGLTYRDYVDSRPGVPPRDWWDINILNKAANERLGYPTQKPEALIEKIIVASSGEGHIVFDPFCGCGTTIAVAERLGRRWVGIDITHLAITLMKHRLEDSFGNDLSPYEVIGDPQDLPSAVALAHHDKYQFEWWALGKVAARPAQDKKKGADAGIDGFIYFFDDTSGQVKKIVVQVKGGHVTTSQLRDLKGVMEREKAQIGAFITLNSPTRPMREEAASTGFYEPEHFPRQRYPRLQILTIEELLAGKELLYPKFAPDTFKKAQRQTKNQAEQIGMFD